MAPKLAGKKIGEKEDCTSIEWGKTRTKQMKSKVNINDDQNLEREADIMGAKAMQLKPNLLETENKSVSLQKPTVQLANGDMSLYLKDVDDINAIDQKASDKSMAITKQEYFADIPSIP